MKPRKLLPGEVASVTILGAVSLYFWVLSLNMFRKDPSPSSQGAFPLFVTSLMILMDLWMLWEMRRCGKAYEHGVAFATRLKETLRFLFPGRIPIILLYVLIYAIVLPKIGFIFSTLAFLFLSMITLEAKKMLRSVLVAVGVTAALVIIFQYIFLVVLP